MDKYNLISETLKFDAKVNFESNIQVIDKEKDKADFDRTTLLTITGKNDLKLRIRFDWCNYSATDREFIAMLIPKTDKLFFGARFFWGVIDLQNKKIDRQEVCEEFWNSEIHSDAIVVTTELEALALNLKGEIIHKVPIDPPFDRKDFDDRVEFDSPVYGRQILKLKQ